VKVGATSGLMTNIFYCDHGLIGDTTLILMLFVVVNGSGDEGCGLNHGEFNIVGFLLTENFLGLRLETDFH